MRPDPLSSAFLGPMAENDHLLEGILLEFVRDHIYWRRNFHPEDAPAIPVTAQYSPEYLEGVAATKRTLHKLAGALKRSVPFYHPRYIGHMASDNLLAGLIAQIVTTLYNPNNVSEESAPVTVEMELEVGRRMAQMFGYALTGPVVAWGHLTGGGTVANYEALWNLRSVKFWPLAAADALGDARAELAAIDGLAAFASASTWELVNLSVDEVVALRHALLTARAELKDAIEDCRIERLGEATFYRRHPALKPPVVLVPTSAHYSWKKGMKVLGLGTAQLRMVSVDGSMRLDADALGEMLDDCAASEQPVLAVVGVLGTTEFGTLDPIDRIVEHRDRLAGQLGFGVHVDAAWGGYMASLFRAADGTMRTHADVASTFHHFPTPAVYSAFEALGRTDSITVDPHKMGYVPFGAGAFVARNREVARFLTEPAPYVFDAQDELAPITGHDLRALGMFILEGSKPGAAAAAVHANSEVHPLHAGGQGRIVSRTIQNAEFFYDHIAEFAQRLADVAVVHMPFDPDTNLVCLAINPRGNEDLAVMNAFSEQVFEAVNVDGSRPLQLKEFFASRTRIRRAYLSDEVARQMAEPLGLPASAFQDPASSLFLLRHTLMSPWLLGEGEDYVRRYFDYLEGVIRGLLEE